MITPLTRRTFLKTAAVAATGLAFSARSWAQVVGANGNIRVAIVGLNGRGAALLKGFKALPGVRIAALCDVDSAVLEKHAKALADEGVTVAKFGDFRNLLASRAIDAVVIATPNHLHALQAIWACQAGKDVYVEKPISHNVWEGRQLVAAATKYDRIVQAGTQCRSSHGLAEAVAWVRAGNLGKITAARGLCYKRRDSIGKVAAPLPPPETVNYDLWLGPAPQQPVRREKFHYDWHWQWETGNGDLGNQGIHQMDVARWFLGESALAPQILSVGGRFGYEDDGETPNTQVVVHNYAAAPLIFEVRGLPAGPVVPTPPVMPAGAAGAESKPPANPMDRYMGADIGVVVHCEGGHILVPSYTSAQAFDQAGKLVKEWKGATNHYENFIEAVRSRQAAQLKAPIEGGHISSALCHIGNISHRLGREMDAKKLRGKIKNNAAMTEAFDRMAEHLAVHGIDLEKTPAILGTSLTLNPKTEQFTGMGARAANKLLTREYRGPFIVPQLA